MTLKEELLAWLQDHNLEKFIDGEKVSKDLLKRVSEEQKITDGNVLTASLLNQLAGVTNAKKE